MKILPQSWDFFPPIHVKSWAGFYQIPWLLHLPLHHSTLHSRRLLLVSAVLGLANVDSSSSNPVVLMRSKSPARRSEMPFGQISKPTSRWTRRLQTTSQSLSKYELPKYFSDVPKTNSEWWDSRLNLFHGSHLSFPLPAMTLITERILPLPKLARQALIYIYCPEPSRPAVISHDTNRDCRYSRYTRDRYTYRP